MNCEPTPYPDLNGVLAELVRRTRALLGDTLVGVYLQGSFALGDFDADSDVDFITVVEEDISESELPKLQEMHGELFALDCPWAQHLEGSYIPRAVLQDLPPPRREFWYLDNGARELVRSDHDDSVVVYWVLREKGVTLAGPEPRELVAPVSAEALCAENLAMIRQWGPKWTADPQIMGAIWYQYFVVSLVCRVLHTLESGAVNSKPAGFAWARQALDPRWRPLFACVQEGRSAKTLRPNDPADPHDLKETVAFINYALDLTKDR